MSRFIWSLLRLICSCLLVYKRPKPVVRHSPSDLGAFSSLDQHPNFGQEARSRDVVMIRDDVHMYSRFQRLMI